MTSQICWVSNGSGNGLVSDSTRSLPESKSNQHWNHYRGRQSQWKWFVVCISLRQWQKFVWIFPNQMSFFSQPVWAAMNLDRLRGSQNSTHSGLMLQIHEWIGSSLVQIEACCLFGTRSLPEPVQTYIVNWTLKNMLTYWDLLTYSITD